MKIYANLIGEWVDISSDGTVEDNQDPIAFFNEQLTYESASTKAKCFEHDFIHVQFKGKDYRIHPSCIQIIK